jgi:hypothetical protein
MIAPDESGPQQLRRNEPVRAASSSLRNWRAAAILRRAKERVRVANRCIFSTILIVVGPSATTIPRNRKADQLVERGLAVEPAPKRGRTCGQCRGRTPEPHA